MKCGDKDNTTPEKGEGTTAPEHTDEREGESCRRKDMSENSRKNHKHKPFIGEETLKEEDDVLL